VIEEGASAETMREMLGPSLADGEPAFHAAFGDDDFLLSVTDRWVAMMELTVVGGLGPPEIRELLECEDG